MAKEKNASGSKPKSRPRSWWRSTAGILTAVTGFLTALAGLLAALHEAGVLGNKERLSGDSATKPPEMASTASEKNTATLGTKAASDDAKTLAPYSATFPSGTEVTLRNHRGEGTYKILAAKVERRSPQQLTLKLSIRLTNKGPADLGFWSDSFRLLIDDVPRSPTSRLNDLVDAQSAKEAEVVFDLPADAQKIVLKVINGQEGELPVVLTRPN